jgi:hypothetical protein
LLYIKNPGKDQSDFRFAGKLVMYESSFVSPIQRDVYYCPLTLCVYASDGDLSVCLDDLAAVGYLKEISEIVAMENARQSDRLADYFGGSLSIAEKLATLEFAVCNFEGKLYGCFVVEMTAPFTPVEDAEFRDWLVDQCTDGYGERLEQYAIATDRGSAYLSFRCAEGDCLILSAQEITL